MQLFEFTELIEKILPAATGMEGDRTGLQIQSGNDLVRSVMTALELTDEVIEEAAARGNDCVVVFHPLIFRAVTEIKDVERVGRLITKAIKNSISVISVHTTFDAYSSGSNKILADKFNFKPMKFLEPDKVYSDRGMGLIAEPEKPVDLDELVNRSSEIFASPVKFTEGKTSKIKKVALVAGSGASYLDRALNEGCDAMITADISYHTFHAMKGRMAIIDPGHYEMEQFIPKHLSDLIENQCKSEGYTVPEFSISKVLTNPVRYYPETNFYLTKQRNYLT